MNPLVYVGLVLVVGGIVFTACAVLFAKEGYEDKDGFHVTRREAPKRARPSLPKTEHEKHPIPPLFSPR